jgi:hypothetical protein
MRSGRFCREQSSRKPAAGANAYGRWNLFASAAARLSTLAERISASRPAVAAGAGGRSAGGHFLLEPLSIFADPKTGVARKRRGEEDMARLCGACCGLVVFGAMVLSGIVAGHSPQHVILRAVAGMFAAVILGNIVGSVGMVLIRDNAAPAPVEGDAPSAISAATTPAASNAS